jgi:ribA/ribD-fused uncharacterized protein
VIDNFYDEYRWLSNFYETKLVMDGIVYPSSEHAYQAHKSASRAARLWVAAASTPGHAKKCGRQLDIRPDWEQVKIEVMRQVLAVKFPYASLLGQRLIDTGDELLVEGNTWGDTFWGVAMPSRTGENHLGRLLMERRAYLLS